MNTPAAEHLDARSRKRIYDQLYRAKNRERLRKQRRDYYLRNKDQLAAHRAERIEDTRKTYRRWRRKNRERLREYMRLRARRLRKCPTNRIAANLRGKLGKWLKRGAVKPANSETLLGCSFEEFRRHLERQFWAGMSWRNYGICGWHIDHIFPCSAFDLTRPDQVRQCFHFTNLRPLWARANRRKGSKITDPQLKLLL